MFLLSLWAHRRVNSHILNTAPVWSTVTWKGWWVKALLTSRKVFQSQSRAGVFTLRAGTDSVLGVSSRSVALQRRLFHSHRGVFVLLREAIQQPHRARILLQPRAEWRARCVPRHNQTLLPSCVPGPARPFLPFPLPPPRLMEAASWAPCLSAQSQWGPANHSLSSLYLNVPLDFTQKLPHIV